MAATSNLTLLMKVFEQEKELFWMNNAGLAEEELQQKWAAHTGSFRSILGTTTPEEMTARHPLSASSVPMMKREQSVCYENEYHLDLDLLMYRRTWQT